MLAKEITFVVLIKSANICYQLFISGVIFFIIVDIDESKALVAAIFILTTNFKSPASMGKKTPKISHKYKLIIKIMFIVYYYFHL